MEDGWLAGWLDGWLNYINDISMRQGCILFLVGYL